MKQTSMLLLLLAVYLSPALSQIPACIDDDALVRKLMPKYKGGCAEALRAWGKNGCDRKLSIYRGVKREGKLLDLCCASCDKCVGKKFKLPPANRCQGKGVCNPKTGRVIQYDVPDGTPCLKGANVCKKGRCISREAAKLPSCEDDDAAVLALMPKYKVCAQAKMSFGCDTPLSKFPKVKRAGKLLDICCATCNKCAGRKIDLPPANDLCQGPGIACDPKTGGIIRNDEPDGTLCRKGTSVCEKGQCVNKCANVKCPKLKGNPCRERVCDVRTGKCVEEAVPDETLCGEREPSGQGSWCDSGRCVNRCVDLNSEVTRLAPKDSWIANLPKNIPVSTCFLAALKFDCRANWPPTFKAKNYIGNLCCATCQRRNRFPFELFRADEAEAVGADEAEAVGSVMFEQRESNILLKIMVPVSIFGAAYALSKKRFFNKEGTEYENLVNDEI